MSMEGPKKPAGKPARQMPKLADQLMPETPQKPVDEPTQETLLPITGGVRVSVRPRGVPVFRELPTHFFGQVRRQFPVAYLLVCQE